MPSLQIMQHHGPFFFSLIILLVTLYTLPGYYHLSLLLIIKTETRWVITDTVELSIWSPTRTHFLQLAELVVLHYLISIHAQPSKDVKEVWYRRYSACIMQFQFLVLAVVFLSYAPDAVKTEFYQEGWLSNDCKWLMAQCVVLFLIPVCTMCVVGPRQQLHNDYLEIYEGRCQIFVGKHDDNN